MKKLKKLVAFCFLFATTIAFAQNEARDYYRGMPIYALDINGPFTITLKESSDCHVKFLVKESLMPEIGVQYSSGTVTLVYKGTTKVDPKDLAIQVFLPELRKLKLNGACSLTIEGHITSSNINISLLSGSCINKLQLTSRNAIFDLKGASKIQADLLSSQYIDIRLDNASMFDGLVPGCKQMELSLNTASKCTLSGNCTNLDLIAKSASNADCLKLACSNVTTKLLNVSTASVHAGDNLSMEISGSSSFTYSGLPFIKKEKILDLSKVENIKQ